MPLWPGNTPTPSFFIIAFISYCLIHRRSATSNKARNRGNNPALKCPTPKKGPSVWFPTPTKAKVTWPCCNSCNSVRQSRRGSTAAKLITALTVSKAVVGYAIQKLLRLSPWIRCNKPRLNKKARNRWDSSQLPDRCIFTFIDIIAGTLLPVNKNSSYYHRSVTGWLVAC